MVESQQIGESKMIMYHKTPLLVLSIVLLIGIGCNKSSVLPSSHELRVGGILSRSGGAAAYGDDADRGARLAFDELNAAHDPFQIKYISVDDKSDKTEALRAARDLVGIDHVNILLGPAISPSAITVGQFADDSHIPMVSTSATQDQVTVSTDYKRQYVFRVCFNDGFQGTALARFARQSLQKRTAIIIYDKTLSYSIGLANNFRDAFIKMGGAVIQEENYSVKDTDYSSLVDKVARYNADLLFIPGWDENVGPMVKQASGKWQKFAILGGDGIPTSRFLELSGGAANNVYALSHFIADDPRPETRAFTRLYTARYGSVPTPFAALGYDAAALIIDAAKRAPSWSGVDLKNAIQSTKNLHLSTGTLSFGDTHDPDKEALIVKITGKQIIFQERIH